ncbi:MAG TPA: methylmalonyl Co-A mutase-associated GTPase MeaB [Acidimicrobiales bacterium]|nr:methylmalonyl Co-A mutase-associated GTPase MeaB [Acidimicrobiales bacterium]
MSSLAERVRAGDRRSLARAITLVESTRADHGDEARALLDELLPHTGRAMRVGVSGAPGAGKSTLIEALGLAAIDAGHRVAVLAVDPSSARTGGSILGDKTRMSELSRHPDAFIRPSPSGATLGGVARRTREAMLLCEAAGFDVVLIETVGVGQSEVAVADLVDLFLFVASPAGGDELQGIKRGIMELADLIVVNKADGDLVPAAQRAASDLRKAVHLLRPKRLDWTVEVLTCSAFREEDVARLWEALAAAHARLVESGALERLRAEQAVSWMWSEVREQLLARLDDPDLRELRASVSDAVASGALSATSGARRLLDALEERR